LEKRFLTPAETAEAVIAAGRRVLGQSPGRTFVLSLLAGFYISFGAQLATVVTSDAAAHVGAGVSRLLGGSVFSVGLMLVVVCGAELFTGNSLLAAAVLHGEIGLGKMLENWVVVILGNLLGALFFAWLMAETRLWESGAVGEQAVKVAAAKCGLSPWVAFVRGVLCNWLVCLAVFMATAARDIAGKILSCYVPIMTFVASGFEHSVANMYFIPEGILVNGALGRPEPMLTWWNFGVANLLPVTLGNVVGGVLFVASAYWYVHLNKAVSSKVTP
jgi:formate/nitrite transporter